MDTRFDTQGWSIAGITYMGDLPPNPSSLLGGESIEEIASAIGKQLMTDECIEKKLRVSYARVLIEMDVTT